MPHSPMTFTAFAANLRPVHVPLESILDVVSKVLGVEVCELRGRGYLLDDFGIDSLDRIELILAIEAAFDVRVPTDRIDGLDTVEQIVCLVNELAGIPDSVDPQTIAWPRFLRQTLRPIERLS